MPLVTVFDRIVVIGKFCIGQPFAPDYTGSVIIGIIDLNLVIVKVGNDDGMIVFAATLIDPYVSAVSDFIFDIGFQLAEVRGFYTVFICSICV